MAGTRRARAEGRAALAAHVAQTAPIGGPPRHSLYPAAEVLDVLHEGVACELRAVVGDDSVWHTKTAH